MLGKCELVSSSYYGLVSWKLYVRNLTYAYEFNYDLLQQFFLELMKVPRSEAKLKVFSYKLQFSTQVEDINTCVSHFS